MAGKEGQSLKLQAEVESLLKQSVFDAEGNPSPRSAWCDDKFDKLLQVLALPPLFSTLRLNTLTADDDEKRELARLQLQEILTKQYEKFEKAAVPTAVRHPDLNDVLVVKHQGPLQHQRHSREVIVGLACGMSVLRGADVFAMGVVGAPSDMAVGDAVSVYADVEGTCLRGFVKSFDGSKLFVGNGRAEMTRRHIFCGSEKVSGVAITMSQPLYVAPSLSDLLPELLTPQNLPSVVCSHVLDPQPGESVLDMCAAPGGKTTHIACLMKGKGRLVAFDKSKKKVDRIFENAAKWHIREHIEGYPQDATKVVLNEEAETEGPPPYPPECFDRVLLDAPCSALGQRPSIRNKMTLTELQSYPALQRSLFTKAMQLLKPGGVMVYSTCTITLEENENMVAWALTRYPSLQLLSQQPHLGGSGWYGSQLTETQRVLVQRFDPTTSSEPSSAEHTVNADTIGFFIAKFRKLSSLEHHSTNGDAR